MVCNNYYDGHNQILFWHLFPLKKAFEDAVEDYLETCKSLNKNPLKSYRGVFNIRTTPEKHETLAIMAQKNGLKLNQLVNKAFEEFIQKAAVTEGFLD